MKSTLTCSQTCPTESDHFITDTEHLKKLQAKLLDVPGVWTVDWADEG